MFGAGVHAHRRRLGLTQSELARLARVSARTIVNIETGRIPYPRPATVRLLADVFELRGSDRDAFCAAAARPATVKPFPSNDPENLATVPRQLPLDVHGFAGRRAELERLDLMLTERPGATKVVVVSGMGGVGKTSLVVHWAHKVRHLFPDGQLHLDLRGFDASAAPMAPGDALRRMLDAFGLPPARVPDSVDARSALYRSLLASRKVLVVLDNARDAEQVRPQLPGTAGCAVIVTSRDPLTGLVAVEGAIPVAMTPLAAADARVLLAARLDTRRLTAEPEAVDEIIERCGRLPLALTIVAAQAASQPETALKRVAAGLRDPARRLDALDAGDPSADVRHVFSWSYRWLSAPAARLFRLFGLHPGPDAALGAIASLTGEAAQAVRPLLTELMRHHLVIHNGNGRFGFHDLVRDYALELVELSPPPERDAAARRMLDHYLRTGHAAALRSYPTRDPLPLPDPQDGVTVDTIADQDAGLLWLAEEFQVVLAAVRFAASRGYDAYAPRLSWTLEHYLDSRGLWREWEELDSIALAAAQRKQDVLGQAVAHRSLSRATSRLGRYDEAEQHCRRAVELFEQLDDPAGQAHSLVSQGFVSERLGRLEEALAHNERALDLFRRAGHVVGEGRCLNNLGWVNARLGNYGQALVYCREAVVLQQTTGNLTSEANAWDSLGYIHVKRGAFPEAIGCYERSIALHRDAGNRTDEADALESMAQVHAAAGDHAMARKALQDALAIAQGVDPSAAARIETQLGALS